MVFKWARPSICWADRLQCSHSVNLLLHAAILSRNQPAEALAHFQSAMALTEETADHWNNIGAAYFKLNDIAASMTALNTR